MAFVNALPALLATLRDIPCDFKWQVFVSKDIQHGEDIQHAAHDGFSLVHRRLQVVAGGASMSNFDQHHLFTPTGLSLARESPSCAAAPHWPLAG